MVVSGYIIDKVHITAIMVKYGLRVPQGSQNNTTAGARVNVHTREDGNPDLVLIAFIYSFS